MAVSMTGFGSVEGEYSGLKIAVEIRSLNSRFFEFNLRTPARYSGFEIELKSRFAKVIARGKIDLSIRREEKSKAVEKLALNSTSFEAYYNLYSALLTKYRAASPENIGQAILSILDKRDIFAASLDNCDEDEKKIVFKLIDQALEKLLNYRISEGAVLTEDIKKRLSSIKTALDSIAKDAAGLSMLQKTKLEARLAALLGAVSIDQARLAAEVALLADRSDITEEVTRANLHVAQSLKSLNEPSFGRKGEFLMQEIGREVNTISAKCQNAEMQSEVVTIKLELEKIREQLQNLE
jgi:uncharacterized protein (TIGR00255 family)